MRTGRAHRYGGYSHKDGQISIAGLLIPAAVTDEVYAWMRSGVFRQQDVTERCIATLRAAKVDPTVGQSLAERIIEIAASSGWIVISHRGVRNIKFWTWAHPVETISAVQLNHH